MPFPGMRHAGLKVISVVLAALLWLLVSGEQTVERALRVPLEFTNLPQDLELVGQPPDVVDVRIRGSSGTMSRMAAGDLAAVLDVRTARPGYRLFHLTAADVRAPFGIEVVQVAPASVSLTFEESRAKTVPVAPRVEGEPAPGFVVGKVTVDPASVAVVGPSSALKNLTEAITEPISVDGATGPVIEKVTIGVVDPTVRVRGALSAQVTVTITEAPVEWAVEGIAVHARNAKREAAIAPGAVVAHVRGPRETRSADSSRFSASIDVSGLDPGEHVVPVRVETPAGVGLLRVDPPQVRVIIR